MVKDTRKGLEFSYNCLDLLSEVKRNGECVSSYLYSADGTKLGVRNVDGGSGYDYVGSLIYKKEDGISVLEVASAKQELGSKDCKKRFAENSF